MGPAFRTGEEVIEEEVTESEQNLLGNSETFDKKNL